MIKLIKRCPEYVQGYKEYCQEAYDNHVIFLRPTNPKHIDESFFLSSKEWYDKKETGEIKPATFYYWAVDGDKFIGEFQLRPEFTDEVLMNMGNIGYAVRVSEQGKGYGKEILKQGLQIAKEFGMHKVLLNINEQNTISAHICEELDGQLMDQIRAYNNTEGNHIIRRYWIYLD